MLAHLRRTRRQLVGWDASDDLARAGLCHAAYGTDGIAPSLIDATERDQLAAVIGEAAEAQVYVYASCDRAHLYRQLISAPDRSRRAITFRDRWADDERPFPDDQLRPFLELTFANELDLVDHAPAFAAEHGAGIAERASPTCPNR